MTPDGASALALVQPSPLRVMYVHTYIYGITCAMNAAAWKRPMGVTRMDSRSRMRVANGVFPIFHSSYSPQSNAI